VHGARGMEQGGRRERERKEEVEMIRSLSLSKGRKRAPPFFRRPLRSAKRAAKKSLRLIPFDKLRDRN